MRIKFGFEFFGLLSMKEIDVKYSIHAFMAAKISQTYEYYEFTKL